MINLDELKKGDRVWTIVENPKPVIVPGRVISSAPEGELLKYVKVLSIYGEHKVYPYRAFLDADEATKAMEKLKKELGYV